MIYIDYTIKKHRFLKDKKAIIDRERAFGILRTYKNYKRDSQYIHRFKKIYKKTFNEFIPYQRRWRVKEYIIAYRNVYKSYKELKDKGFITEVNINNKIYNPTEEVEEELFRREMCVFRDWRMWLDHRKMRNHKNVKFLNKKCNKKSFWMIIPETGRKFKIGLFLPERAAYVEKIYNLLCKNSYIFDEKSEYYMPDKEIEKMIRNNFNTSKDLNFDIKTYAKSYNNKIVK